MLLCALEGLEAGYYVRNSFSFIISTSISIGSNFKTVCCTALSEGIAFQMGLVLVLEY